MLELPIKRKWFNMILQGEKKVEYREIKEYWATRFTRESMLEAFYKDHEVIYKPTGERVWVLFKNGYGSDCPRFKALVSLSIGTGEPKWGAVEGVKYYRLYIHRIEQI